MSSTAFVQVVVGGMPYCLAVSDIEKYPGSFFECMIKKERISNEKEPVTIERDGTVFKYVNAFLVVGHLPRDKQGQIALEGCSVEELKEEADFFGLKDLSKECDIPQKKPLSELEGYMTIRKFLKDLKHSRRGNDWKVEFSSPLIHSLKEIWSPFCLTGEISKSWYWKERKLYKESSLELLQLDELIAGATQSPFGRGTETVTDTTVRNSFEIPASELNSGVLRCISTKITETHNFSGSPLDPLAPHLDLELRPYKLVIYQEGGHFHEHRDTVRGENHIGTLVVILNSEYTGGELEVSHGGRTESVSGPFHWVAMYGDCLHKINPVTSGTRVSLIYDIYGTAKDVDEEDEDMTPEEKFWDQQEVVKVVKVPTEQLHQLTLDQRACIKQLLRAEFDTADTLILTLQHLYPECQTSPAFLKGGDRALFDLLSEDKQYDAQVLVATIYRYHDDDNITTCELFALPRGDNLNTQPEENETEPARQNSDLESPDDEEEVVPAKKQRHSRTKVLISTLFDEAGLLDYSPYIEHTGNESQAGETVYVVAGLQVTKRAV